MNRNQMYREIELQSLKRLESFIKESIPRYKTRLYQGRLYVETIFNYLEVRCLEKAKGVAYLILDANFDDLDSEIAGFEKEDQLRKFFKDLYDEEVRLEDKYIKNIREITKWENRK